MQKDRYHFIGIGGIGMSALARLLLAKSETVLGSDLSQGGEAKRLESEGATIFPRHLPENIEEPETTVIYSTAIGQDNPEIIRAKELGCRLWHRSELLNDLMQPYKSLAVAGTHGKTSTSALLTHVLISSNLSPTYVIGGISLNQNTNSERGEGKYFVIEADESDGTFVKYHPHGSIITNLEEDHLDYYYKDLEDIKEHFVTYLSQVKESQYLFWCKDCPNLSELSPKGFSYGFHQDSDLRIISYSQRGMSCTFSLDFQGKKYEDIELSMMGRQNALNASAIFGLCIQLGLSVEQIREAFKTFRGIKRRAERIGRVQNIEIIDDYAHHPTEIEYALKGVRKAFPKRRVIALFQPHRYSRVKHFHEGFSKSFKKASEVWLTDVYRAGETPLEGFSEKNYAKEIEHASGVPTKYIKREELIEKLLSELKPHDVVVTLGAGDITQVGREAYQELLKNPVKMRVGVICGSRSLEHYVSLISKRFFTDGLDRELYSPTVFKIDLDGNWALDGEEAKDSETLSLETFKKLMDCDLFLPIVHGPNGEDGMIQGFLKTLKKPFIGPDFISCALSMNKVWTKSVLEKMGIKVSKYMHFSKQDWSKRSESLLRAIGEKIKYPLVAKPVSLGSSIGVSFAKNEGELIDAIEAVFEVEEHIMIEERVFGREFEIAVLEGETLICPRPGEIPTNAGLNDYQAKYLPEHALQKVPQADLSKKCIEKAQSLAKNVYRALQGKGFMRVDFFIDKSGQLIFNEANPIPGFTPKSLFPRMLKAHGLSSKEIIDHMIITGLYNHRKDQKRILKSHALIDKYVTG